MPIQPGVRSGIAIALTPDLTPSVDGLVMLHEAGHFFGLSHTTELGGFDDPLSDTPNCPGLSVSNAGSCPDADYLLFPGAGVGKLNTTSPLQRRIVQGSPAIRAFDSD